MSSEFHFILIFLAFVMLTDGDGESACVDVKAMQKTRKFHSTRRNLLSITNTSCSINYFDMSSVTRLTFNVMGSENMRRMLQELDLSSNGISAIHNETFDGFVMLERLSLSNNFLQALNEHHFRELRALTSLDLSLNLLKHIDLKTFSKLHSLLWLSLSDNCLINTLLLVLPINTLHSLNLSHNRINSFPQLVGISAITALDISHNDISDSTQIEIVRNVGAKIVKSISSLNLAGNQLRHPNQLLSFVNLVELNLANNVIEYDENDNFVRNSAGTLAKLNLTNTNLTSLNIFRHVSGERFRELSLSRNPLHADFDELAKFSSLQHLQFQQKFCREFDSYRTIRKNFKHLKSVTIFYDDTASCACVQQNEMLFKYEHIDFITDSSVCSAASGEEFYAHWPNVVVGVVFFALRLL
jgi:hypothetical protein